MTDGLLKKVFAGIVAKTFLDEENRVAYIKENLCGANLTEAYYAVLGYKVVRSCELPREAHIRK
jgi:uncharacterized protein with GYD domain